MTPRDPITWEQTLPLRPSSPAWVACVRAIYGVPLSPDELALYHQLSGGIDPPVGGSTDVLCVIGRRGGKSETMARVAMFEALHGGHEVALAPGQRGRIVVISPLREQSQEVLGYAKGIAALPQIRSKVASITADSIEFSNGLTIQVCTCDALNVSGPTIVCLIRDEWSKWPGAESATPDTVIEASVRPALAPVVGAPPRRKIGISSAYITDGQCYTTDRDCFGKAGADTLVLRGSTITFNPNIDREYLAKERRRSPSDYEREYECVWQDGITEGWFGSSVIDASVVHGRSIATRARLPRAPYYVAIDAAFKGDRFALAVAHMERSDERWIAVLDLVRTWEPRPGETLSSDLAVHESSAAARGFGCDRIYGDQCCAPVLIDSYRREHITLVEVPWTAQNKPLKYRMVRDGMADGSVWLCDDAETVKEFKGIQGKLLQSGGERIEARRGHDDRVSAAVLALSLAMKLDSRARPNGDFDYASFSAAMPLGDCGFGRQSSEDRWGNGGDPDWPSGMWGLEDGERR